MIDFEQIQIVDCVKDWKEGIEIAARPLLNNGLITNHYVEKMISNVESLGPYIVISKDIAIPHARPEDGAKKTALSLLKLRSRVAFTESQKVNIIIVLASSTSEAHVTTLKNVATILSNKENYSKLLATEDKKTICELFKI